MARQTETSLYTVFGFVTWGDFGPVTIYRNKQGKMVWFPKTYPAKPPSPAQQEQRDRFAAAALAWQALTPTQRAQWELASRRASLSMHGYDIFVHWTLIGDDDAIRTLERQTGTTLLPP